MPAYDLRTRTKDYALMIIGLFRQLPRSFEARTLGRQLFRSGTSVGAHYREGRRARSNAEYAAKLNGGLMELEESMYWLELLEESSSISAILAAPVVRETYELTAIFVSLIKKSKSP